MEFTNAEDLIQVFINEYSFPNSINLMYGNFKSKNFISIDTTPNDNVDIVVGNELPFEDHSFDLILSFKNEVFNFKRILKPNGKLLLKGVIIDALEYYTLNGETFSVI